MATASPPDEFRKATVVLWELAVVVRHYSLFGIHWIKQSPEMKKLVSLETTLKDIGCMAFSPDGEILAVGGFTDGVVQLWKVDEY